MATHSAEGGSTVNPPTEGAGLDRGIDRRIVLQLFGAAGLAGYRGRTSGWGRRLWTGILVALIGALIMVPSPVSSVSAAAAPASHSGTSGQTTTLTNFTSDGKQVARFDTNGNAIDAHDGQIVQFGNTYYLYGTSYNCGYRYNVNSSFCGFTVYSSSDLVHWTDRGYVALPRACADCFRPHVLYNSQSHKYVLWVNDASAPQGYRVYTNDQPTGLFTEQNYPRLTVPCGGDFTLFEDTDGAGYLTCPNSQGGPAPVEQLTGDYLSTDGRYTLLSLAKVDGLGQEAPSMFVRNGIYYITMSDPACPYCTGTGTGYMTASSPLGPWHGAPGAPQYWSAQGGALQVVGGGIGLSTAGANWADYTYSADVTPLGTGNTLGHQYAQAGMVFRADDAGNGYAFLLSNYPYDSSASGGYVVLIKFTQGNPTVISSKSLPSPVVSGTSHHVSIEVRGSTSTISVDGALADTVTDATYATGKVGFWENGSTGESATFDNVRVTAPDGTVLLADDFSSSSLSLWNAPASNTAIVISSNSCGGQPSFVAPLRGPGGDTVYLYGSDLWDAHSNEGLANYFWAPLQFNSAGDIQPIQCSATTTVSLATGRPGHQAPVPGLDQTSGVDGFSLDCTVAANDQVMQTFTAGHSGELGHVRFTAYQEETPTARSGWVTTNGDQVNAPLVLRLVTLTPQGTINQTLTQQTYDTNVLGFAARDLTMSPDVSVRAGQTYGIVASSTATQGCYGFAYNDANPYGQGQAWASTDGGHSFETQPQRDLKFLTVVR